MPSVLLLLCLAAASLPAMAKAVPASLEVWAVNDGEKILAGDLEHPSRKGNACWDGRNVSLFGVRNETVACQLVVLAKAAPLTVRSLTLRFGKPTLDQGVEILSEHYFDMQTPSTGKGWGWDQGSQPRFRPGLWPDALIPLSASPGKGGLPLSVSQGRLQAFWIDIPLPRDLAPGAYAGTILLSTDQGEKSLPLRLSVYAPVLPDENAVTAWAVLDPYPAQERHGRPDDEAFFDQYRFMAHRHRLDYTEGNGRRGPKREQQMAFLKPYFSGEKFTPANGYHGPGEGVGLKIYPIEVFGPKKKDFPETEETYRQESDWWVAWFKANAPGVKHFFYVYDEPKKPGQVPQAKQRAQWIRSNPGPGGKLPTFLTFKPVAELSGLIDLWSTPPSQFNLSRRAEVERQGAQWTFYHGERPYTGCPYIDAPATDFRSFPWIAWRHRMKEWYYWYADYWYQEKKGFNLFKDVFTFDDGATRYAGDGSFFYPGQSVNNAEEDRGYPGPIASIRLKNLRRGQEDVGYMELARHAGKESEARAIVEGLLKATLSEAKPGSPVAWPESGDAWEKARAELLKLILEAKAP